jgi:transcriptional accessory protein Tex/SPT6
LPSVLAEYNRQLGFRVSRADELLARAQGINSDFDNKETSGLQYSAAVTALQTLKDDAQTFRNSMGFLEVPEADVPGIDPVHKEMVAVAQEMVDQADAMVAGLKSPDTGEARKAALDAFETAVADYKAKVDELIALEPA